MPLKTPMKTIFVLDTDPVPNDDAVLDAAATLKADNIFLEVTSAPRAPLDLTFFIAPSPRTLTLISPPNQQPLRHAKHPPEL